jgi:hypothetical protein
MIDHELLHATKLTRAPGRSGEAWLFEYGREAWVTDSGGGSPERIPLADLAAGGVVRDGRLEVELLTAEARLTEGGTLWQEVGSLEAEHEFPPPVADFRAGKVWLGELVRAWMREHLRPAR